MPLYEYRCPNCGATKERRHCMHVEEMIWCDKCETDDVMGNKMEKQISAPSIHFKGKGFHCTDN